jgi:hypothetical protein
MAYPKIRDLWPRAVAMALACGSLWIALHATAAQIESLGGEHSGLKRVGLVIHGTDKRGNPGDLAGY